MTITHTKIYGYGAADILRQNEINAKIVDGNLVIVLNKTQVLAITAQGDVLKYQLEDLNTGTDRDF